MGLLNRQAPPRQPPTPLQQAVTELVMHLAQKAGPSGGPVLAAAWRMVPGALAQLNDAQLRDALMFVRDEATRLLHVGEAPEAH